MKDVAKGMADLLVSAGLGTFAKECFTTVDEWGIYVSRPPKEVIPSLVCQVAPGGEPWPHLAINFPGVDVVVVGFPNEYQRAYAKSQAVVAAVLGKPSSTVNGDIWRSITMRGDVSWLGYDESNRPCFSAGFRLIVEPQTDLGHRVLIT